MIHEAILEHFVGALGRPVRSKELPRARGFEPRVTVHEWDRTAFGFRAFATVGFAENRHHGAEASHRVEFILAVKQMGIDTAAWALQVATTTPIEDRLTPRSGDTIGLPKPISGSRGIQRLLLTDRWGDEKLRRLDIAELSVHVLMAVPIFECELGFLRSTDEPGFWAAVEREKLDMTDLTRGPLKKGEGFIVQRETVKRH
ncbi:MAG: suppressor of fused domain protein [Acidobacteria bacterium]|nr:suppressor of fused domain protein [Acidobacteriota bacterium]